MAKCLRCGQPMGFLAAYSHCQDCRKTLRVEDEAKQAERDRRRAARQEKEAARLEKERAEQISRVIDWLKQWFSAGNPVVLHENVYIPVDSTVDKQQVCDQIDFSEVRAMGLLGWRIVGIVPRTLGVALSNSGPGGVSWGAGIGGNVVGVYVLLSLRLTKKNCNDSVLHSYAARHLDEFASLLPPTCGLNPEGHDGNPRG